MVFCRNKTCVCRMKNRILPSNRTNDFENFTLFNFQFPPPKKLPTLLNPRLIREPIPLTLRAMSPDQSTATLIESFPLTVAVAVVLPVPVPANEQLGTGGLN